MTIKAGRVGLTSLARMTAIATDTATAAAAAATAPAAKAPEFPTITAYLIWDHDRLDGLLVDCIGALHSGERDHARVALHDFCDGLRRHIRVEEEQLFPALAQATGTSSGPMGCMHREHAGIQQGLRLMETALDADDAERFQLGLDLLMAILPGHNQKEEQVLYPLADRVLPAAEQAAMLAGLERTAGTASR